MQLNVLIKKWYAIAILIIFLILTVLLVYSIVLLSSQTFYKGIYVEDINLVGLNKDQARDLIEDKLSETFGDAKLILKDKNNTWQVNLKDISFEFLEDETINKAYKIGRNGGIIQRLYSIFKLRFNNEHIYAAYSYDSEMLKTILEDIKAKIDKDERNAEVLYNNGNVAIKNEEIGRFVDIDKSVKLIENHIVKRDLQGINLNVDEIVPRVISKEINVIRNVLATFSTSFNANDENRSYNIKLACEKINNCILYPGELFSMNKTLGPRTEENGYLEAPVIFKNELVKGTGGGVCQVTTTLYDAVLKSKLEVVERTHHSIPLGYVEPGQDATIAEDFIDFKFRNNRDYPICINSEVKSNKLNIRILGKKEASDENIVKLKSEILEVYTPDEEDIVIDDSVPDNEKVVIRQPVKGYKAALYRETYKSNGEMIERERISEDIYNPVKPQIKVNSNYLDSTKPKPIQ